MSLPYGEIVKNLKLFTDSGDDAEPIIEIGTKTKFISNVFALSTNFHSGFCLCMVTVCFCWI